MLIATSCGKDNESTKTVVASSPSSIQSSNIIGSWSIFAIRKDNELYDKYQIYDTSACLTDDVFTFNSDNTFTLSLGGMLCPDETKSTITGNYSVDGGNLILDTTGDNYANESYPYAADGEQIQLTIDGEVHIYTKK